MAKTKKNKSAKKKAAYAELKKGVVKVVLPKKKAPSTAQSMPKPTKAVVALPVAKGEVVRSASQPDHHLEVGTEWIADLQVTTTAVGETVVYDYYVSPTTVSGRLSQMAVQWERWQPRRLSVDFASALPATTAGLVSIWYDPDIRDDTPTVIAPSATAVSDSVRGPVWTSMTLPLKNLDRKTLFFTRDRGGDTDDLFEFAGQIYVSYTGPIVSGLYLGRLSLSYEIDFSKRCYEPVIASAPALDADEEWPGVTTLVKTIQNIKLLSEIYATVKPYLTGQVGLEASGLKVRPGGAKYFRVLMNLLDSYSTSAFSVTDSIRAVVRDTVGNYGRVDSMPEYGGHFTSESMTGVAGTVAISYAVHTGWTAGSSGPQVNTYVIYFGHVNSSTVDHWLDLDYSALAVTGSGVAGTTGYCTALTLSGLHIEEISPTEYKRGCGYAFAAQCYVPPAPLESAADTSMVMVLPDPVAATPSRKSAAVRL